MGDIILISKHPPQGCLTKLGYLIYNWKAAQDKHAGPNTFW